MNLILTRSVIFSILLHIAAFSLMMISLDFTDYVIPAQPQVDIIDAVAVDEAQVQEELAKLQELEQQKKNEELERQRKLNELESRADEVARQRREEEQRLADTRKKQEAEERRVKEEAQKLADLREKQAEQEKLRLQEEQRLAEARRKQEELKRQQEEIERKRREEAERARQEALAKAEAQRKRKEEEARKAKLAEEQRALQAAQERADANLIQQYVARITSAIQREFNTVGMPPGLSCILHIRMIPGGEVAEVRIVKSSGNGVFDTRAETAVQRASPLPVPEDSRVFGKMREIRLTFAPN